MTFLVLIAVAWVALALPFGLLLGRGMRIADGRDGTAGIPSIVPDFIPASVLASVGIPGSHRA